MDIKLRRGTTAEWAAADPVLPDGVMGFDRTLGNVKIGDGVKAWSALNWAGGAKGDKGDTGAVGPMGPIGLPWIETNVEITATVNGIQGLIATIGDVLVNGGNPVPGMMYIVSGLQAAVTSGGTLGGISLFGEFGPGFSMGKTQFTNVLVLNDTLEDCVVEFPTSTASWIGPVPVAPAMSYVLVNFMVVTRPTGTIVIASAVG